MYSDNNLKAVKSEALVADKLQTAGIQATNVSFIGKRNTPDFITSSGLSIDVKYAQVQYNTPYEKPFWRFNCHHHGAKQLNIDFFVFILKTLHAGKLIFVFPDSMIKSQTFAISLRQLDLGCYNHFLDNWELITGNHQSPRRKKKNLKILCKALQRTAKTNEPREPFRHSISTRVKMSHAHRGKTFSPEHRAKLAAAHLGVKRKPFTEEHKQKMSEAAKGRPGPMKGKHHTEETRLKMIAAWKKRKQNIC